MTKWEKKKPGSGIHIGQSWNTGAERRDMVYIPRVGVANDSELWRWITETFVQKGIETVREVGGLGW